MTNWKSLTLGVLIAPLATFPAILLVGVLYAPFIQGRPINIEELMGVALIGTVLFSYPATLILGLSTYGLSRKYEIGKSYKLYLVVALVVTIILSNRELFDKNGLWGFFYLTSASACSCLFWYIPIPPQGAGFNI